MATNVFSGARRLSFVVGVLWVLATVALYIGTREPLSIRYSVEDEGFRPQLVLTGSTGERPLCWYTQYLTSRWTDSGVLGGRPIDVSLCLKLFESDGLKFLRYPKEWDGVGAVAIDPTFGDSLYRPDGVSDPGLATFLAIRANGKRYIDSQVEFVKTELSKDSVRKSIRSDFRARRFRETGQVAAIVFAGLLVLYSFTFGVGWIVRGFLGIPRGMDSQRPPSETTQTKEIP